MPDDKNTNNDGELNKLTGLTTTRIQSLGDSIFAFAMTLLVLNFRLPTNNIAGGTGHVLVELIPHFIVYVLSFIALGVLWVAQHNQYNWIQRSNRSFLWINIFFFMFVVLIPFSTDLLASYNQDLLAVMFYGINLIICTSLLYLHWSYATNEDTLVVSDASNPIIKIFKARMLFVIVCNIAALLVSFISVRVGILILILIQILSIVPSLVIDRLLGVRKKLQK